MEGKSLPVLLVTANVGSIFEDPDSMLETWAREFLGIVRAAAPRFVALHCQEMGGKNYEHSMQYVHHFIQLLLQSPDLQGFDRTRVYVDEDYSSAEHFTALGNIYLVHESVVEAWIWDFCDGKWTRVVGSELHSGNIEHVSTKDKAKFPQDFFPECKWSRKGYMRTRWRLGGVEAPVFDLVNIHLFHDASNLVAMETFPSAYCRSRRRALLHTLHTLVHKHASDPPVPHFVFGDFNFRTDTEAVIKKLTDGLVTTKVLNNKNNEFTKLQFHNDSDQLVLTVGKKEFNHSEHQEIFLSSDGSWLREFDVEPSAFSTQLCEFPVGFPPSYPYEERDSGSKYMCTRVPAWCDRVLLSPGARALVDPTQPVVYDVIGPRTCMGDHKPVYLSVSVYADTGIVQCCQISNTCIACQCCQQAHLSVKINDLYASAPESIPYIHSSTLIHPNYFETPPVCSIIVNSASSNDLTSLDPFSRDFVDHSLLYETKNRQHFEPYTPESADSHSPACLDEFGNHEVPPHVLHSKLEGLVVQNTENFLDENTLRKSPDALVSKILCEKCGCYVQNHTDRVDKPLLQPEDIETMLPCENEICDDVGNFCDNCAKLRYQKSHDAQLDLLVEVAQNEEFIPEKVEPKIESKKSFQKENENEIPVLRQRFYSYGASTMKNENVRTRKQCIRSRFLAKSFSENLETLIAERNRLEGKKPRRVRLISVDSSLGINRLYSHHSSSDEDWFEDVSSTDDEVWETPENSKTYPEKTSHLKNQSEKSSQHIKKHYKEIKKLSHHSEKSSSPSRNTFHEDTSPNISNTETLTDLPLEEKSNVLELENKQELENSIKFEPEQSIILQVEFGTNPIVDLSDGKKDLIDDSKTHLKNLEASFTSSGIDTNSKIISKSEIQLEKKEINMDGKILTMFEKAETEFEGLEIQDRDSKIQDSGSKTQDRGSKLENMGSKLEDRGSKIEDRSSKLEDRDWKIEDRGSKIQDRDFKIQDRCSKIQDRGSKIRDIDWEIEGRSSKIQDRGSKIRDIDWKIEDRGSKIRDIDWKIEDRSSKIEVRGSKIRDIDWKKEDRSSKIQDRGSKIRDIEWRIEDRSSKIEDRGSKIQDIDWKIEDRSSKIQDRGSKIRDIDWKIEDRSSKIQDRGSKIRDIDWKIEDRGSKIRDIDWKIEDRSSKIEDRGSKIRDIDWKKEDRSSKIQDRGSKIRDIDWKIEDRGSKIRDIDWKNEDRSSKIQDRGSKIRDIDWKIEDRGSKIRDIDWKIEDRGSKIRDIEWKIEDRSSKIEDRGSKIQDIDWKIEDRSSKIQDRGSKIRDIDCKIEDRGSKIQDIDWKKENRSSKIQDRGSKIQVNTSKVPINSLEMQSQKLKLQSNNFEIQLQKFEVESKMSDIFKNSEIKSTNSEATSKNSGIQTKNFEIPAKNSKIPARNSEIQSKYSEIQFKNSQTQNGSTANPSETNSKIPETQMIDAEKQIPETQLKNPKTQLKSSPKFPKSSTPVELLACPLKTLPISESTDSGKTCTDIQSSPNLNSSSNILPRRQLKKRFKNRNNPDQNSRCSLF